MAFTEAQEEVLRLLIDAFQNGKRLSDLPNVTGTNPYDLFVEVLDTDGESKKAALATLLPYFEDQCAYGVERDKTILSSAWTRVGNMNLHRTLPIQSRMRGCLLDDNGKVIEYLDPLDWTKQIRDGSRGQVMVEIPMHYRRFITDGNKQTVMISEFPLPGYHQVPQTYVSAYEASIQRSTNKLSSVVNTTADYRGGENNAAWDSQVNSLLGMPVSKMTLTELRTAARNRKAGSTQWNAMAYSVHKALYWLYVVEYANFNVQLDFVSAPTSEGYKQGGLSMGVSGCNKNNATTFNNANPIIPCGYTDELGNASGIKAFTLPAGANIGLTTVNVPRYRGVENPFGHIMTYIDGVIFDVNKDSDIVPVYVTNDPAKFDTTDTTQYSLVGNVAKQNGWGKEVLFGEGGECLANVNGGADAGWTCDLYSHWGAAMTAKQRLVNGGMYVSSVLSSGITFTAIYIEERNPYGGTRLCFIP